VPLRAGGGMRVKILEALAKGIPVVSTTIGCEGIAIEDGRDILIADTAQDFADATLKLLEDKDLANTLAQNGRALAETIYDYRIAYQPINRVYEKLSTKN
ncbi:MAG: glycosyltransferase, partial [Anaerolineaceae bacterium]|nr:glycosyltransferase [Anaerolineaceae bacterium]